MKDVDFNDHELNDELAEELAARLNVLIQEDDDVRTVVERLLHVKIAVPQSIAEHATIQTWSVENCVLVSFLGLLNGLAGVLPAGPREGWGRITVVIDTDTGRIDRFQVTER